MRRAWRDGPITHPKRMRAMAFWRQHKDLVQQVAEMVKRKSRVLYHVEWMKPRDKKPFTNRYPKTHAAWQRFGPILQQVHAELLAACEARDVLHNEVLLRFQEASQGMVEAKNCWDVHEYVTEMTEGEVVGVLDEEPKEQENGWRVMETLKEIYVWLITFEPDAVTLP